MAQRQPTHYYEKEGVYLYVLDGKRFYTSCSPDDVVFKRINGEWVFWEKCLQGGGSPPAPPATLIGALTLTTPSNSIEGATKDASVSNDGDATALAYDWTVTNGTIKSGQGSAAIKVQWGSEGSGSVSVSVSSADGFCDDTPQSASADVSITVKQTNIGTLTLTAPNGVTENTSSNCSIANDGDAGGLSYNWSVNGGTIDSGQGTNAISVSWGASGDGQVSCTVTSSDKGVQDSPATESKDISINFRETNIGSVTLTGPQNPTEGESVSYEAMNDGDASGLTYSWVAEDAGHIVGESTSKTVQVKLDSSGSLSLTVTVVSSDPNCPDSPVVSPHSIPVAFPPETIGEVTVTGTTPVSVGDSELYSVTYDGSTKKPIYRWDMPEGVTTTAGGGMADSTATITFDESGTKQIKCVMDSDDWMVVDRGAEGSIDVVVNVVSVKTEDGDELKTEDDEPVELE